jgi:FAD/FMN-containing dehydrogenase
MSEATSTATVVPSVVSDPAAAAARQLRSIMRGTVLVPSDVPYDAARQIWNGAVDRRPAVIARIAGEAEIATAVRVAREYGLPLSVRGGGHDWAGRALRDGGLVLDLSALRGVTIDADTGVAVAQGGATAGDVVAAAARHGLAPVTGAVKAVGMAGLTLAGGYGPLNGKHGLALDNLLGADVVLADGRRATAGGAADADLYWALRGGGGNFGVVATTRLQLHPLASVLAGMMLFPLAEADGVLRGYWELVAAGPDELTVQAGFISGPDGQPLLFLYPTWSGEQSQGEEIVARLQRLGTPVMAQVGPMPYENSVSMFDPYIVNGRHDAIRTRWLPEITEETAPILVEAARGMTTPFSGIVLHHFHGAASRVPAKATAFALRRDHLLVEIVAAWDPSPDDDGTAHRRWADALSAALAPHALPGGYPNLLGPDESARTLLAYGPNVQRLRDLKRRFDPDGVFSSAVGTFDATAA